MKLGGFAKGLLAAFEGEAAPVQRGERRGEPRQDFLGRKVIVRQAKTLGILHLRNLSPGGACGISDMPLAVGSLVFVELKRPHFHAAYVVWASNVRIGLALVRPLRPEQLARFSRDQAAAALPSPEPRRRA